MRISQVLSELAVRGGSVVDLTPDDSDLFLKSLLPAELELSYRRELRHDGPPRSRDVLVIQHLRGRAATPLLGPETGDLGEQVVQALFTTHVEALLEYDVLAAASHGGWRLDVVHATGHPIWRLLAVLRRADPSNVGESLRFMNESRLNELVLRERELELEAALDRNSELLRTIRRLERGLESAGAELQATKSAAAQSERLDWKLRRRNQRVRELESELQAGAALLSDERKALAEAIARCQEVEARFTSATEKLLHSERKTAELEAELHGANQLIADLRRSLGEHVSRARTLEVKLEGYRRAVLSARSSMSFRLGRATKVALRGKPLEIGGLWLKTFKGRDEILESLGVEPDGERRANAKETESENRGVRRTAQAKTGNVGGAKQPLTAWWGSPKLESLRKRTQSSWEKLTARAATSADSAPAVVATPRVSAPAVVAAPLDVTQQWLHVVTPPPTGRVPPRQRLELPPSTAPLPAGLDLAAFDETWRRLCQARASAASIGEVVGKKMDDMDEALRTLLPSLAQKSLVDAPVPPIEDLELKPPSSQSYVLPTPIDWTADPQGLPAWRFWLQNLGWLDRLRGTRPDGLAAAAYIVVDWAERVLVQDPPLEMTWEEHSVRIRLARVWRFLQAYIESSDVLNRRVVHAAVHIVLTHVYALTRKEIYVAQHSSGLMQDHALLMHVAQLPALRDHDQLVALGEYRLLHLQLARSVTEDAVHHENSPHYHILFAKILAMVLNESYATYGRKPPEVLLRARDALLETFLYLLQPDMTVPQMGDSVNGSRKQELAFVLEQTQKSFPLPAELLAQIEYVRTDGKEGKPPEHLDRVFVEGGYACFRDRWAPGNAKKAITAHFRCSRLSDVHYHEDETSFEIFGYGRKLIAESGRYNNDKGSALHTYQRSARAHNVMTVDGQGFRRARRASAIVNHRLGRYVSWVQGSHDYYAALGIEEYVRTFAYSRYNFFVVLDSLFAKGPHFYEQHIHLHPSLSKLSFPAPGTVVATTEGKGPAIVLTTGTPPEALRTICGKDAETDEGSWYFPKENVAEPATDVIFRYRREGGRVHLPLFVMVFPSAETAEVLPFEHEVTDREFAVAIEPQLYARHIVLPLYQFANGASRHKKSRADAVAGRHGSSNKLDSGG